MNLTTRDCVICLRGGPPTTVPIVVDGPISWTGRRRLRQQRLAGTARATAAAVRRSASGDSYRAKSLSASPPTCPRRLRDQLARLPRGAIVCGRNGRRPVGGAAHLHAWRVPLVSWAGRFSLTGLDCGGSIEVRQIWPQPLIGIPNRSIRPASISNNLWLWCSSRCGIGMRQIRPQLGFWLVFYSHRRLCPSQHCVPMWRPWCWRPARG